jgi:hypothetical protein
VRRLGGKAVAGEGRRVGKDQRRTGGAVDAPVAVTCVRQWNVAVFFIFLEKPCRIEGGAEEAYWARSLGRPRNEPSGRTRLDGRPCASIIELIKESREASSIIVDNGHRLT